ncbi:hypothetical protein Tco_1228903 [Tanacetum coccineum]
MYYKKNVDYVELLWEDFTYQIDNKVSPEEPARKSKRVKRPAKKSTNAPTTGVVIIETLVMSLSKKKEKMIVNKHKGIDLLFEVALTEEAQYEKVRKKSLRDFHKTHPSSSGTVTKIALSAAKIKPSLTNERSGAKPGVPGVTKEESTESEAESWGNDENDSNNDRDSISEGRSDSEHETDENETCFESDQKEKEEEVENDEEEKDDEFVKTPSISTDDKDETNDESKVEDKAEGFIQKEGIDAEIINVQQGNENMEISINQVIEDAHVTISTVPKKTEVPATSSSQSSELASKFLKFSDIPHTDAEVVSPMDVHVHHEVPSNQTPTLLIVHVYVITDSSPVYSTVIPQSLPSFNPPPQQSTLTPPPITEATNTPFALPNFASVFQFNNRVTALEKEVTELKKDDPLNTQVTALIDEHLDSRLGATIDEFINYMSVSITARITEQVKIQLPQILPKEVSNFAPPKIKCMVTESLEHAVLAKESSQPKSTYEVAASLTKFELKKILIDKIDKSQSYLTATKGRECYDGLIKSYDLDKSLFSTYDRGLKKRKTSKDAELTKGPKIKESKSGSSKGTKSQSTSSRKHVHVEEQEFEVADSDMPQYQEENLSNDDEEPKEKVASKRPAFKLLKGTRTNFAELEYEFEECYKALSEKLDWDNPKGGDYPFDLTKPLPLVMNRNRQMTFYGYARGLKSTHDVYSTKRILTEVEVMRKHGYGYFREIEVRRADNDLYTFKEGDFPRLPLRMFTRSMVIQKRVEDLQLGVKSYQKKINVTKSKNIRPSLRKKDSYTPYQDPQEFIYVDNQGRNMLMRSDELYKFSDGTLIRLRTSLDDITKNIRMEYLP